MHRLLKCVQEFIDLTEYSQAPEFGFESPGPGHVHVPIFGPVLFKNCLKLFAINRFSMKLFNTNVIS